MFHVSDFHRVLVAHEVELVSRVVVPNWVYVGFALRISVSSLSGVLLLERITSISDWSIPGDVGIAL